MAVEVGLGVVLLDVELVVAGIELPVQVPEVITRQILPVRGKLDREPDVGTSMQPVQEPLHHGAGDQLQIVDLRQHGRVQVLVEKLCPAARLSGSVRLVFLSRASRESHSPEVCAERLFGPKLIAVPSW